jgi:hypothetical protein
MAVRGGARRLLVLLVAFVQPEACAAVGLLAIPFDRLAQVGPNMITVAA